MFVEIELSFSETNGREVYFRLMFAGIFIFGFNSVIFTNHKSSKTGEKT